MKKDSLTYSFLALREKLHRSALGYLQNDEDAKDALQDSFFNLWKAGNVESDSEAGNKLFAVLRNICIDRLRKPKTLPLDQADADSLEINVAPFEDMDNFESLLTTGLTDIQRRIYHLVVHEGMEYDNISESLGMTVDAVRMNMSRARKKVRENYKRLKK